MIDSWFGRGVEGQPAPYHPFGRPPAFMEGLAEMGIDTEVAPTFDEVIAIWSIRSDAVGRFLDTATGDDLARVCAPNDGPRWPPIGPGTTAVRCLRVVLDEVGSHHRLPTGISRSWNRPPPPRATLGLSLIHI